jgi:hypothetical protein
MLEGGRVAVTGNDDVTSNHEVREVESRTRTLERGVDRDTPEVEPLEKYSIVHAQNWPDRTL